MLKAPYERAAAHNVESARHQAIDPWTVRRGAVSGIVGDVESNENRSLGDEESAHSHREHAIGVDQ